MTKELIKSLGSLAFYLAVIVGVIYFVGIMAREMGIRRAMIPQFISDISWYRARLGGFNIIDYAKFGAFAFLVWFPCTMYVNILSAKFFPPSVVALRADIALTKLVNEKGTRVEENDIRCFHVAPDCISIRHSARATVQPTFYSEHEGAIENSVGVDFTKFVFMQNSEVRAYFQYGSHYKVADILIERPDNRFQVIRGNGGKYVYAIGDNPDLEKCETLKIGFVEKFQHIENRLSEAARWDSRLKYVIVAIPVNGRQDETAIHRKLEDSRLRDADEPGRELFANTVEVRTMVQGWINEMQVSRNI